MVGLAALGGFVLAFLGGWAVFHFINWKWQLPTILNLPGAILTGMGAFMVHFWSAANTIANSTHIGYAVPPPTVEWRHWAVFVLMAAVWYVATIGFTSFLRSLEARESDPHHGATD